MLTDQDIQIAAADLGCDPAAVRAVIAVESAGAGFLPDGRCKILFEAHWFAKFTGGRYTELYPQISSPRWNKILYQGGDKEWDRLNLAISLDRSAALKSASWGSFQIMGFNHTLAGYDSVEGFVSAMEDGEAEQLRAFVRLIKALKLADELQDQRWMDLARTYNGSGQVNYYAGKLAAAFTAAFKQRAEPEGLSVHRRSTLELQAALSAHGFPVATDGWLGDKTKAVIAAFQRAKGLTPDGVAGPQTRKALGLED